MANRVHLFDAAAYGLHGKLTHPLHHEIKHTAHSRLGQDGGYFHERSEKFHAEGVISYESARTRVAGNVEEKDGHGWATLTTSVIEHFNILDVVTVDRMVAQILLYFPLKGYVPQVTFLGTRFENLRIAGHPVDVDLHLDQLGERPADPKSGDDVSGYLSDSGFLQRVVDQRKQIYSAGKPPAEVVNRYSDPATFAPPAFPGSLETSLVYKADVKFPEATNFGHVIEVRNFGKIYLATLRVSESEPSGTANVPKKTRLSLRMIEFEMGSMGAGRGAAGSGDNGGGTIP
jgi:hypothetical protein